MNAHLFDWKALEAISHINLVSLETRSSDRFSFQEDFMHTLHTVEKESNFIQAPHLKRTFQW